MKKIFQKKFKKIFCQKNNKNTFKGSDNRQSGFAKKEYYSFK